MDGVGSVLALAWPGMKRALLLTNRVLLTLLGMMTGAVKLGQMAEEMALFANAGFSTAATMGFGFVQLAAAIALLHVRSARAGAITLLLTFVIATGVLFINAMIPFGLVSLVFIAMAALAASEPELGAPLKARASSPGA